MLSSSPSYGEDPIAATAHDHLDDDAHHDSILTSSPPYGLVKSTSAVAIIPKGDHEERGGDLPTSDPIIIVATTSLSPVTSPSPDAREPHPNSLAPPTSKSPPQQQNNEESKRKGSSAKMKSMFVIKKSPSKGKGGEEKTELREKPASSENLRNTSATDLGEGRNTKMDCSVSVKVFEARNLPEARQRKKQAERNSKALQRAQKMLLEVSSPNLMNFSDATDPYCVVQVEKMKMRTRTIEKKLNPFWCEEFTFEVQDASKSKIVLNIVDEKKYSQQDEVIGRLVIPLNSLRDQREREQWFPIQPPHSSNKIPQIHLYIEYDPTKLAFVYQILGGRNLGLGVAGAPVPYLDFAWKQKDNTTKDETFLWNDIHPVVTKKDLSAPLEMFSITLWRWKMPSEYEPSEGMSGSSSEKSLSNANGKEKLILGQIHIPLVDLSAPRDYWFCLYGKSDMDLGDLRVKIKYTEEVVLTLEQYQDFLSIMQEPNMVVVQTLGAVAVQNTREAIAYNLVRVFEKTGKGAYFLNHLSNTEIDSTPNPDIIFRGNSLATKSIDQYMKLVGTPYLNHVLRALIKKLYASSKTCEVDPTKLEKGEDLKQNWKNLMNWVNLYTEAIFDSLDKCPASLRQVFNGIQEKCKSKFPGDIARYTAVSGFIFLRFFCPAILAPKLFNLAPDHPGIKQTRYLILIAKTLQNLANLVEFGSVKEEFMKPMNEFVVANMENMKNFIDKLSSIPDVAPPTPPTSINLEKELASMYRHILRHRDEMMEYHRSANNQEGLEVMARLNAILAKVEEEVKIANAAQLESEK